MKRFEWIAKGKYPNFGTPVAKPTDTKYVQCCSDVDPGDSADTVRTAGGKMVWGSRFKFNTRSCLGTATYDTAIQMCKDRTGGRLCTAVEYSVTAGTGCGYDNYNMWVRDPSRTETITLRAASNCPQEGCGECAGSCQSDSQCKKGLKCFVRRLDQPKSSQQRAAMMVPGCGASINERNFDETSETYDPASDSTPERTDGFDLSGATIRSAGFCYKP